MLIESIKSNCPHCGEVIELVIDCSVTQNYYIEDCQVCCRPIGVTVFVDETGVPEVSLLEET